jgi:hypothetical protein
VRRQRRIDQIALATSALLATGSLALRDGDAGQLKAADKPGTVAAAALNGEGGHAELQRPTQQRAIASLIRLDLAAIELRAQSIESDRDMNILVRVDADCHRPQAFR